MVDAAIIAKSGELFRGSLMLCSAGASLRLLIKMSREPMFLGRLTLIMLGNALSIGQ
jgi:hypothetical protein